MAGIQSYLLPLLEGGIAVNGISTVDASVMGEDYVQECVSNMIRKYGTDRSY